MSSGIAAMWDDADEYQHLADLFKEKVRVTPGGLWPYHMDNGHFKELKKRHQQRLEMKRSQVAAHEEGNTK